MEHDWLDRLAQRAGGGRPSAAREPGAPSHPDERLSRTAAVRLALVGLASVSLGLWRAPEGRAGDLGDCLNQCGERYGAAYKRDLAACANLYQDEIYRTTKPNSWARLKAVLGQTPWQFVTGMAKDALLAGCEMRAGRVFDEGLDRCDAACRETCPRVSPPTARFSQSRSRRTKVCRPTTPPRSQRPELPPAPNPANDPCAGCNASTSCACCPHSSGTGITPCTVTVSDLTGFCGCKTGGGCDYESCH